MAHRSPTGSGALGAAAFADADLLGDADVDMAVPLDADVVEDQAQDARDAGEPDAPRDGRQRVCRRRCQYDCGVHPSVAAHLPSCSVAPGITPLEYRRRVMGQTVREWPQAVPAQVIRTRLLAYKALLTDAAFALGACACCAREKRRAKLLEVVLPARAAAALPDWLARLGWTPRDWERHGEAWWDQLDAVL